MRVEAPWLAVPDSRRLLAVLTGGGKPARFVGGCVRDALIHPDRDAADLDLATPERPEQVIRLLEAAALRVIPTGIEHGTVTALVGRHSYEITTLRRDVACFGRRAEVEFTHDYAEDAARRDFTINAMSCDGHGLLFDYFGGLADLLGGRVRFVGAARQRIQEDYLRILRFFRFYARFGHDGPDADAVAACRELAHGIDQLSGERVHHELWRILVTERAAEAVRLMAATGVLVRVVPWPVALERLERLAALWPAADAPLRLAALSRGQVGAAEAGAWLTDRLKLSNAEIRRLERLLGTPPVDAAAAEPAVRQDLYRLGAPLYADLVRLAVAEGQAPLEAAERCLAMAAGWEPPRFPLSGADLLARGMRQGPALGRLLEEARAWWAAGDFKADGEACRRWLDVRLAADHGEAPSSRA